MVQSSRGWDKAPHSGWGVKPSAPSKGKGAKPPKGAPSGAAFSDGFGASWPLPSPRAASPLRPPSGSHAPPAARTSPPLPALVGPGRQLGALRAPAAAVGPALGVQRAVSAGRVLRGAARGWRRGPGLRARRVRAMEGSLGWGALLCLVRPRHPPAIDCPFPQSHIYKLASAGPGEARLGGARGWHVWVSLGKQRPGWAGRRPRPTCARCRVQRREPEALWGGWMVYRFQAILSFR